MIVLQVSTGHEVSGTKLSVLLNVSALVKEGFNFFFQFLHSSVMVIQTKHNEQTKANASVVNGQIYFAQIYSNLIYYSVNLHVCYRLR